MSDTDANDSGFDKEAERERLREKYGGDSEEQAQTERMSELLLQGATMTNRHCGECGNPIFRYEGQSFCSVCEEERPAEGQADASPPGGQTGQPTDGHATEPGGTHESGTTDSDGPSTAASPRQTSDRDPSSSQPEGTSRPTPDTAAPDEVATPTGSQGASGTSEPPADLGEARAALVRTLSSMATQAETTEDVTRAKDYLGAAREAAEALAALDRARQR